MSNHTLDDLQNKEGQEFSKLLDELHTKLSE